MPTFGLLGPLVVRDGTREIAVGGPKVRVLLTALLLQANRTVSKDALVEALWGPRPPATAPSSLFNHVTRLRRQLAPLDTGEPRLGTVPSGYRLRVAEGEFDVEVFDAHVGAAHRARADRDWERVVRRGTEAAGLWRGRPLEDLAGFAEAEEQARTVRELCENRLLLTEWEVDAALALGRHHEVLPRLTALASEHPLREAFHRQLMLALYRSDRQAEALRVYARLRRDLVEELGVEPSAAVRTAHREVLAGTCAAPDPRPAPITAPRPGPPPPRQLPTDTQNFTGRTREIATLTTLLRPTSGAGNGTADGPGNGAAGGPGNGGGSDARRGAGHSAGQCTNVGSGHGTGSGTGHGTGADTLRSNGADTSHDTRTDTRHRTGADTRRNTGADTSHDTRTDTRHDTAADTRHATGAPTNAGTGHDTAADTRHATGAPTNARAGHDAGADAGHGTGAGTGHDTGAGTGTGHPDAPRPPRLVVVSGMGGVGKTALAVHVAHRLRQDFPDGQLHADLRGFGAGPERTPRDLLARFLADLGVPGEALPEDTDDRAALFRTVVAGRRMLLVLDNARDAAQVTPLLPGSGGCAVLVTSRHVLADLPDAAFVPLSPLGRADQEALLTALCGARRVLEEPAAAAGILDHCGGLPLALRVVGGRLASRPEWPLSLLAGRLASGADRLGELSVGALDVRAVLAASYVALRDGEGAEERAAARAFRLLGLWPGHELGPSAAAALLGTPVPEAARLLDLLADAALVRTTAPERYGFHDLLGAYAAERARAEVGEAERADATARLLSWYAAAVGAASRAAVAETQPPPPPDEPPASPVPEFTDARQALAWYVRELPAVAHAITRAGDLGRSDVAWRLAVGLFGYAETYWWTGEWDTCLRAALDIAVEHGDAPGQAWLYRRTAVAHGLAHRDEACLADLHTALALFERAGDVAAQASITGNLSALHVQAGRAAEGLSYALRSMELYRGTDSAGSVALVHGRIADALHLAGDFAGAAERHRRRIPLLRSLARPTALATALTRYGAALRELGLREQAFAALDEALALRRGVGDHGGEADCLAAAARAHHHFGDTEAARRCREACLALVRAHALPRRVREGLDGVAVLDGAR
ncbi:AfsR/SARP family transcriptional regulator [Streptomyces aureus]|uniref:AfsR/SARP family transcriptional regulator n=1 Tax=Streptomyces aureus TaxID=193461 RepID=UPI00068BD384|nr:AfsR/SARP family transcriptional regulator [Streptomyces aureus]